VAGRIDAPDLDVIDEDVQREVDEAWAAAREADWPSTDHMTADVYTSWPEGAR
jgi:pyruvate dehydrogenase E1 component alpha subunit